MKTKNDKIVWNLLFFQHYLSFEKFAKFVKIFWFCENLNIEISENETQKVEKTMLNLNQFFKKVSFSKKYFEFVGFGEDLFVQPHHAFRTLPSINLHLTNQTKKRYTYFK